MSAADFASALRSEETNFTTETRSTQKRATWFTSGRHASSKSSQKTVLGSLCRALFAHCSRRITEAIRTQRSPRRYSPWAIDDCRLWANCHALGSTFVTSPSAAGCIVSDREFRHSLSRSIETNTAPTPITPERIDPVLYAVQNRSADPRSESIATTK